jgi:hypothetical protein
MARGSGRGRGWGRGRGRGRGAAAVAAAAAQEQATEQDSPLSTPVKANDSSNLVPVIQTEVMVSTETTEAMDLTVIESEQSVEVINERHFASEERSEEEQRAGEIVELGDTADIGVGNGSGALMEFSVAGFEKVEKFQDEIGMVASANGSEKMREEVGTILETVESAVPVPQGALEAPSCVDLSAIETSLVTTQMTPEIMEEIVPLEREVNESAVLEFMNQEETEGVLEEIDVENTLRGPAISTSTVYVKAEVVESPVEMEIGTLELECEGLESEYKHVTTDLGSVKLELGDEKTNVDYSDDRLEEGNEDFLKNAGNFRDQAVKNFDGEMDDKLGEQNYEDFSDLVFMVLSAAASSQYAQTLLIKFLSVLLFCN